MTRPNPWFRMYHAVLDNPKVQRLSGEMFKAWVNILCLASRWDGKLPPTEDVAFALRIGETQAETLQVTLRERGLLDFEKGVYFPHDWDDLQFVSDTSTERVKQYRERTKKRKGNVSETPGETPQEQNRAETEKSTPKAPRGAVSYPKDFEAWWEAYPHKVAKDAALKAWQKAIKRVDLETLIAAAKSYIARKSPETAYANPATWLNGGRWMDAPAGAAAPVEAAAAEAVEDPRWALRVDGWNRGIRSWNRDQWGPTPDEPGCKAPTRLLKTSDGLDIPACMRRTA